jgi:hypothetical protein
MHLEQLANQGLPEDSFVWLQRRLRNRWYPRDLATVVDFLSEELAGRNYYLYGAGTHSKALLEMIQGKPLLTGLLGILDRQPQSGQKIHGFTVFPASKGLEDEDALIVLSHAEFEDNMEDDLLTLGIAPERILSVYQNDKYGALADENLAEQLNSRLEKVPAAGSKKRIAVVSARNRRILDSRTVSELREQFQWISINMERIDQGFDDTAYDVTLPAFNGISVCLKYLAALQPDLIYVQEHYSSGNFLPIIPKLFFPQKTVIGEFYDFLGLIFDDPYILSRDSYWREKDVQLGVDAEKWAISHLDGIVTKESGGVLQEYLAGANYLEIQPHLPRNSFVQRRTVPGQPLRLVWAGAIAPSHLSTAIIGNNQLLDVFSELVELGFEVTAYSSCPDWATLESQYADYLELAQNSNFKMLLRIPQSELIEKLATEFDYGIAFGRLKDGHQQGLSNKITVSGKIFSYIAAGLPILVADYYDVMGSWVKQFGLGVLVDPDQLQSLPPQLEQLDHDDLVKNIYRYRETHNFDCLLPVLAQYLKSVIGQEQI